MRYDKEHHAYYRLGEKIKIGYLHFTCRDIKYTVQYHGKKYLVLPVVIEKVGWFDMTQEALKGMGGGVVLPWKGCNLCPGQMTYTDEVDDENIFAVLGIELPDDFREKEIVNGQWEINYDIEASRREKLQIDCHVSKLQLSEIELDDSAFVKELKCSYQKDMLFQRMRESGTAAAYARDDQEGIFAAAYAGDLLKLAKCFYEQPDGRGVPLIELYEAFLACGYGAMEIPTEDLTFYPDWDGCVRFLCSYLKYLLHAEYVQYDRETALMEDRRFRGQILDIEEMKQFYQNVCEKTEDDYYERWIRSIMELSTFTGWQDENREIEAGLFPLGENSLKNWEITAMVLWEAERSSSIYDYQFKKLEDSNFMVNGRVEEEQDKIRRAKNSSFDLCILDCCSFEEGHVYGQLLEEMKQAEELKDVAYVTAKISWLLGKPVLFPYTLYEYLREC